MRQNWHWLCLGGEEREACPLCGEGVEGWVGAFADLRDLSSQKSRLGGSGS